ncbi:uroporphyrinogen decarboxylase [Moorella thermoacetica]|uniref:Uroporphyrinogen decarboxylase n=1 Tax=Neomoorella thermoacetica TaxID=1525 RepID=A0A1J5P612_NEOTH|nr:uroporphyrinogen decarboxylase [Moorella thermoacetica]
MSKTVIPDEMTPRERIKALKEGKPYDRIPCDIFMREHAARLIGATAAEIHLSPRKMAAAAIAGYRVYGADGISIGPGLQGIAEALGCKMVFPEESTPYLVEHIVNSFSDLEHLEPPDPDRDGRLPIFLDALAEIVSEVGKEVPVVTVVAGPFTTAANIRGTENFLKDVYRQPGFAHRLLRLALASTIPYVQAAARIGVSCSIADPTASGSVISPRTFREFALPYLQELVEEIKRATGAAPSLHICGNTRRIWRDMAATGAACLSLDDVIDLAEAKATVGDKVILVGNIRPARTMYLGTPADVVANVKECLRKAYDNPKGYILALGCGLPAGTPPENIHALMEAARRYGRYPFDPELFSQ